MCVGLNCGKRGLLRVLGGGRGKSVESRIVEYCAELGVVHVV